MGANLPPPSGARPGTIEITPGATPLPSLGQALQRLSQNRFLLWQLAVRELAGTSKGSFLGALWSWVYPLLLLAVYTFVFSQVFRMRWGLGVPDNMASFGLVLFCGFIPYTFFATVTQRASTVIVVNANLVSKVLMPLELLPASLIVAASLQLAITTAILLAAELLVFGSLSWGALWALPVLLAVVLLTSGVAFLLAVAGVFIRDVAAIVSVALQMLFFLTPLAYPITAVPERYRGLFMINPLTPIVIDWRAALLEGQMPHWHWIGLLAALGLALTVAGYRLLLRSQRALTEVL